MPLEGLPLRTTLVTGGVLVGYATRTEWGVPVEARSPTQRAAVLEVRLEGATVASLRVDREVLTIADDLGRVIAIDLQTGARIRDLRMRA